MLFALVVCLGLAGVVVADSSSGHVEPKDVTASCGPGSATLSWSAVMDDNLSGYDVYEKLSSGSTYTQANGQLVTGTSYVVGGLQSVTSYDFGVVAVYNDGHTSVMSLPATCTTA